MGSPGVARRIPSPPALRRGLSNQAPTRGIRPESVCAGAGISESIGPDEIIPFLNDYAQAVIDPIHDAGGDVLKLIGDGVLAMFTGEDMAQARRAGLRAEHLFRKNVAALNARREADGRPTTSAYIGLHVGEVLYGNIGSEDRLDFTVVGPTVNEVSRIASMSRSVDRELLASAEFYKGLDTAGRRYLVSTGRYAPYPAASERPPRGPIRETIRRLVLAERRRRRPAEPARQALGA